jgi:large subunit ribosomal protein L6
MSRIWKNPILIPSGVSIEYVAQTITVTWPKWVLSYTHLPAVSLSIVDSVITVLLVDDSQPNMWWLTRSLVANMVQWVSQWFEKKLHVIGVGYNVKAQGNTMTLNLWYSHPINYALPATVTVLVEKDPKGNDIITLTSPNKQLVGEVAAKLKSFRKPEPYKGKWVRYFWEQIKMKAGKTTWKK